VLSLASWQASADPSVFFDENVEPLFVSRCLSCHGAEQKGGLDLRSKTTALAGGKSGAVLVSGKPDESLLFQLVADGEMPPKHPLNEDEVSVIRQWIADGAYFPAQPLDPFAATTDSRAGYDWWSLQPLGEIPVPTVESPAHSDWAQNPIDRFVLTDLSENDLAPSQPASPRTLLRRATYGLTGLPPTPDEVATFLHACEAETGQEDSVGDQAYADALDRLLASPRYGEHWGRHWLDVVRFGESTGFEVNHLIDTAWPFRDYVIRRLNEDSPFDQMVMEHLAADAVSGGDPEIEVGMTFLVAGPSDIVGNQDPVQAATIRANTIDEIIRATGESFLGLTVGCARCHDHKFDPVSQRDYYSLYATFAGVYHDDRGVATPVDRAARDAKVRPLEERKSQLEADRNRLEEGVRARAESKRAEYVARWPRAAVDRFGTEETFASVEAKYVRLIAEGRDNDVRSTSGFTVDEFEVWTDESVPRNVAASSEGGTAEGTSSVPGDFGAAYSAELAIDGKFGERFVARAPELRITFDQPYTISRVFFSSDRNQALSPTSGVATFLCEYRIETSIDGENWTEVVNSHDREPLNDSHRNHRLLRLEITDEEAARRDALNTQVTEVDKALAAIPDHPRLRVGRLQQPSPDHRVFLGGDTQRNGPAVVPASMRALDHATPAYSLDRSVPERDRRVELARWIMRKDNPLTSRVLVNRLWHYHFGTGIVATPSDFGYMGGKPSHPELLDWLAREFIVPSDDAGEGQAWRLKRLHKRIMLSQTYRQSGAHRAAAAKLDSDSRLLWRFPPRRLTGEEVRDTMLAVAGQINTTMGGPGFRLYDYQRDNVSTYVPLDVYPADTYRRSVYHQNARASRVDLMTDFDSPDCAMAAPRRATTTTPLQALTLMNHQFTMDMASHMAERVRNDADNQIGRAFELAFSRPPSEDERISATNLAEVHGLEALCRALLNANEFVYIR
jgi:mono/diheme cytochrome c family protein